MPGHLHWQLLLLSDNHQNDYCFYIYILNIIFNRQYDESILISVALHRLAAQYPLVQVVHLPPHH